MVASARWDALGCDCEVLTVDSADLAEVAEFARGRVQAVEECCSRFGDSELATLPRGHSQRLSPVLSQALGAALRTAEFTNGLVDPTLGTGWTRIEFDPESAQVTVPEGVEIDLGAIGKAWAADWIAEACVSELGAGVLVNLGGDISVRGETPSGGWQIEIVDGHRGPQGHPVIAMGWPGGLATSSTVSRSGSARRVITDPATGRPPTATWRTVTVAARSCQRANAGSLAATILGDAAPRWLSQRELPARLVHVGGVEVHTNGWPQQRFLS